MVALLTQIGASTLVVFHFLSSTVIRAIHFNDQFAIPAGEVGDVWQIES